MMWMKQLQSTWIRSNIDIHIVCHDVEDVEHFDGHDDDDDAAAAGGGGGGGEWKSIIVRIMQKNSGTFLLTWYPIAIWQPWTNS